MKYEYQDAIIKELLKQKGNEIDKSTLKTAVINVFHYEFGHYESNPKCCARKPDFDIHINIATGIVCGIRDKQGSEYAIDFTVYEMDYPIGEENHILCVLDFI